MPTVAVGTDVAGAGCSRVRSPSAPAPRWRPAVSCRVGRPARRSDGLGARRQDHEEGGQDERDDGTAGHQLPRSSALPLAVPATERGHARPRRVKLQSAARRPDGLQRHPARCRTAGARHEPTGMRNRQLHAALAAFAEEAAFQLASDTAEGAEVPFEVVELGGSRREAPLYCYRPLTASFIDERLSILGRLASYLPAVHALAGCGGLDAYLVARGEAQFPAQPRARAEHALRHFLTRDLRGDERLRAVGRAAGARLRGARRARHGGPRADRGRRADPGPGADVRRDRRSATA